MSKTVTHKDLHSYFGEEDHLEISQSHSFASLIFESLSEKAPSPQELSLFELILNLSIDHGTDTPSATKVIEAAKEGKTMSESIAEGILQINDRHGGAIEPAMNFFYKVKNENLDDQQLKEMISEFLTEHKIIGGFGHRIYKNEDPRTKLIFTKLNDNGLGKEFIEIAERVQAEIQSQKGIKLPINIDGSIAVVLCSFGWEAKLGNAVFITARTPGLLAHYLNNF